MGSLFPRLISAGIGKTHHAHFRLPRHRLSDRLAFGASTDGCGRHSHSSCNTRWNAIAVSADSRRGSTKPLGLTAPIPLRRFTAGAFGFLTFTQCGKGPERTMAYSATYTLRTQRDFAMASFAGLRFSGRPATTLIQSNAAASRRCDLA